MSSMRATPVASTLAATVGSGENAKNVALDDTTWPVTAAGLVCPAPVAYIEITDPLAAGLLGALTEPSWFRTAACPDPVPASVKMPGAAGATVKVTAGDFCPLAVTCTCVLVLPLTSNGTIAEI